MMRSPDAAAVCEREEDTGAALSQFEDTGAALSLCAAGATGTVSVRQR
jgi:hypothetical protein